MMIGFPKRSSAFYKHLMDNADSAKFEPVDEKLWEEMVKNMLRAQMMLEGVSYVALAERLAGLGIVDNELNLRNKVGRGRFTAVFFMQCMKALGADRIKMPASLEEAAAKGAAQAIARNSFTPNT